jgi:hypothetical protein
MGYLLSVGKPTQHHLPTVTHTLSDWLLHSCLHSDCYYYKDSKLSEWNALAELFSMVSVSASVSASRWISTRISALGGFPSRDETKKLFTCSRPHAIPRSSE